jgi:hypothetical protein
MNFEGIAQATTKVERKRYRKVIGDYAGTTYGANAYDRGLSEVGISNERTIQLTSGPLDEGEFLLVSSLLRSKQVYMLDQFDGVEYNDTIYIRPVVVETAENVEHRPLDSKLRSVTITVKESNPVI